MVMITRREALLGTVVATALTKISTPQAFAANAEVDSLPRVKIKLVAPPFVHEHIQTSSGPKVAEVTLTIIEKEITLDEEGTTYRAMTYEGWVPGPMIVVFQDDYVDVTLINPETNELPHNIDFHAATGGMGGGELTNVNPGEQARFRFKATRAGTFVYHCAPMGMVPWHVVSGMSGTIMVLPRDGLKNEKGEPLKYDRIYYIGENDFYVPRDKDGKFKRYETASESSEDVHAVMRTLVPSHIVFNGAKGALTGDKALSAKVGETVFFVHSQASRDTRPHLIGGHGDYVWELGKFANPPAKDLETWFIRGGSAGAALYTFLQPGFYAYVNHNLIESLELGAVAHINVEGTWNEDLMTQLSEPGPITK